MSPSPSVTVLMTVHNGERYLAEAIDSVLAQTIDDFELIVVDDASTDGTAALLTAYAGRDSRVRVLRNQTNLGPYPSANLGLAAARAAVVARLDADDVSEPDRLARQLAFLRRNPRCLLVGSGYRSIDDAGCVRFTRRNPMDSELAAFVTRLRMPMVHPSFCFRRHRTDGTPTLYDLAYPVAADYALAATLSREGQIACVDQVLVRYRMHSGNISTTRLERQRHFAHQVATGAVAAHYPSSVAARLAPLLSALYRLAPPAPGHVTEAVRGLDAALAHDFGARPPASIRRRTAGILAEAFLGGFGKAAALRRLPEFIYQAPDYLVPLAIRSAELRNWLKPAAGSAAGS